MSQELVCMSKTVAEDVCANSYFFFFFCRSEGRRRVYDDLRLSCFWRTIGMNWETCREVNIKLFLSPDLIDDIMSLLFQHCGDI